MNILNQAGKSVWSQCVDSDCGGDRRAGLLQLALQLQRILVKRHFGFTLPRVFQVHLQPFGLQRPGQFLRLSEGRPCESSRDTLGLVVKHID